VKKSIGWIAAVRPSRRPLHGFLRMRKFPNAIEDSLMLRSAKGASRSARSADAACYLYYADDFFTGS
jgi:hypothetical protein